MSDIIGNAQIILAANTARFEQDLVRAKKVAGDSFSNIKDSFADMSSELKYGAAAIAGGFALMVKSQIDAVDEMSKFANVAGVSVQKMQEFSAAAKILGMDTDDLNDVFEDLNEKIGEFTATGEGELKDLFDKLPKDVNLTAEAFRKMSGPEALQAVYNNLEKCNLTNAEMIKQMEDVASESSKLIPMLKNNGEGFKLMATAAENAGATMDKKTIRASQEMKVASDLMGLSLKGVQNQMTQGLIPVLSDMAGSMLKDTDLKNKAKIAGDYLAEGFKFIVNAGRGVVGILDIIGIGIGALIASFATLGDVVKGVNLSDPTSFFQIGSNAVGVAQQVTNIWSNFYSDIKTKIAEVNKGMGETNSWGSGLNSGLVKKMTDIKYGNQDGIKATVGKAKIKGDEDGDDDGDDDDDDDKKDWQMLLYKGFKKHGLSDQWAKLLTAEVGRENSYNPSLLFGGHKDAANAKANFGIISWQGSRRTALLKFLQTAGVIHDGTVDQTPEALDAEIAYLMHEIMDNPAYQQTKNAMANSPNIDTQQGFRITGDNLIAWDRRGTARHNGKLVLGKEGAARHAARRDKYYQEISAKALAGGDVSELKDYQQQQKDQQRLTEQFADDDVKIETKKQKALEELRNSGLTGVKAQVIEQKILQEEAYDKFTLTYQRQKKQWELARPNPTEYEKIARWEADEGAKITIDRTMTDDQKKQALWNIEDIAKHKANLYDLAESKREYNEQKEHFTTVNRIELEGQIERREIELNLEYDQKTKELKTQQSLAHEEMLKQNAQQSFQDELEQITGIGKSELQKIMDDFEKKRRFLDKREDIDDDQKSTLRNALAGAEVKAKSDVRKTAETGYNAMLGDITGNTAALELNNKYKTQHETLLKWKQQELITTEKYNAAMQKSNFNYMIATNRLYVSTGGSIANSVSEIGKIMLGENQKSYKALFAMNQSFVMAQAGLNMYKAISDAWANGSTIYDKMAGAATAATELVKIVTAAQQVKMQGFASGGYTGDIPENAVAGLVHGGEYVFDAEATKAIGKNKLEKIRRGDLDPSPNSTTNNAVSVNVAVNHDGSSSVESSHEMGKNLGNVIQAAIQKELVKQTRQGGLLSTRTR